MWRPSEESVITIPSLLQLVCFHAVAPLSFLRRSRAAHSCHESQRQACGARNLRYVWSLFAPCSRAASASRRNSHAAESSQACQWLHWRWRTGSGALVHVRPLLSPRSAAGPCLYLYQSSRRLSAGSLQPRLSTRSPRSHAPPPGTAVYVFAPAGLAAPHSIDTPCWETSIAELRRPASAR